MSNSILPIVAIIGQPNVGKSTLLNKIAGSPLAVTSPVAGTTRDRQYADTMWNAVNFTLVDTAGLNMAAKDELEHNLHKQVEIAMEESDIILLVADGRLNRLSLDQKIIDKLFKAKKPLVLAVNKLDTPTIWDQKVSEFMSLGIKNIFPVSSLNGRGLGDLLDFLTDELKKLELDKQTKEEVSGIAVSIVGKPNVGKSSIFNRILKEERVVVSAVPGTTRTAIDSHVAIGNQDYTFIDTAGLKKKTYRQEQPDIYGGFQTFKAIRRSDVSFLVIESISDITKQDQRVAQEIISQNKGVIILANKIDLFRGDREKLQDYISAHFPFLWMSPVFFVSGKTGEGLDEAVDAIKPIYEHRNKTIDNQTLSEFLTKKLKQNEPKLLRDQKKPKVFSLHQFDVNPPSFELLVNHPAAISQQFRKFVENSIIKDLDFWGTPIVMRLRGKDKT
jgi:GTP-binding protein